MDLKKIIKPQLNWTWILLITYVIMSFIYPILGLFGFLCMIVPIFLNIIKQGKMHCSHICPRASFFNKFLTLAKWKRLKTPNFFRNNNFKYLLLIVMFGRFTMLVAKYYNNPIKLAINISGLMFMSITVGVVMGLVYNARSWCQICPMMTLMDVMDKNRNKK